MKRILISLFAVTMLLSCKSSKQKDMEKIQEMEKQMKSDASKTANPKLINDLITAYSSFADKYRGDEKAGDYLFNAGELSNSNHKPIMALGFFTNVYEHYPDNAKAPVCLFLQGFIAETELNNTEKAKEKYTEFLTKYPNHELAKDVRFSIQNLGKSNEELIKMFEQNNQTNTEPAQNNKN